MTIKSEIFLPGFLEIGECKTDVVVKRIPSVASKTCVPKEVTAESVGADGDIIFTCPYGGLRYQICGGQEIIIHTNIDNIIEIERLPLYGFAIATILQQHQHLVFHASSVEIDGKAVVVIGGKAQGKSTLIAALVRRGHRLITDEVTAVHSQGGKNMVFSGVPCIKLWPDALRGLGLDPHGHPQLYPGSVKRNYFLEKMFCPDERELGVVLVLDNEEGHGLQPLTAIQKMLWLSGGWYFSKFHEAFTPKEKEKVFKKCSLLARKIKMAKLTRPKSIKYLEKTCCLVEDYIVQTKL